MFPLSQNKLFSTDPTIKPDGITHVPWKQGKQLLWDVTVVDALAPSRLYAGSVGNPGIGAAEAEERKKDRYKCFVEKGYLFQSLAFEIQGSAGPSSEEFFEKSMQIPLYFE